MIRIVLPTHLWRLAGVNREIELYVDEPVTISSLLDTLETSYPMLRGTIRDPITMERRAFIRFFAAGEDLSHEPQDAPLPAGVVSGQQPLRIVGALAGG